MSGRRNLQVGLKVVPFGGPSNPIQYAQHFGVLPVSDRRNSFPLGFGDRYTMSIRKRLVTILTHSAKDAQKLRDRKLKVILPPETQKMSSASTKPISVQISSDVARVFHGNLPELYGLENHAKLVKRLQALEMQPVLVDQFYGMVKRT